MSDQARDVILGRLLTMLDLLFLSRNGLTMAELRDQIAQRDCGSDFGLRTIRRDAHALIQFGLVEVMSSPLGPRRIRAHRGLDINESLCIMGDTERAVILRRVCAEVRVLLLAGDNELTTKKLQAALGEVMGGEDLSFSERTIRRDCMQMEHLGLVEPSYEGRGPWRFHASRKLRSWFQVAR